MDYKKFQVTGEDKGFFILNVALNGDVIKYITELADLTGKEKEVLEKEIKEDYLENGFFKIVSLILERATYGQHSLEINYQNAVSTETDIVITKNNTDAFGSRIWNSGHIEFSIDHIYSPGLMLHELGHYLYGLGDEYKGCRKNKSDSASIMQYSFGNNVRFKRKFIDNDKNNRLEDREYKVLGGFDDFWEDYCHNGNNGLIIIGNENNNVVTDFCYESGSRLKHNAEAESEQNNITIMDEDENKKKNNSCWAVMLYNVNKNEYSLKNPFEWSFEEQTKILNEIKNKIMAFNPFPFKNEPTSLNQD